MENNVNYLVQMENIDKSFPGVQALKNCSFRLKEGEVHALCGENGAGKSTLMKILSGVYQKDRGRILISGIEEEIDNTAKAIELGINIIHQELQLMPHLTAADNIFLGREPRTGIVFDKEKQKKQAASVIQRLGLNLDPGRHVKELSIAQRYMVEIAKAVSYNSKVLIMDEPTSALTEDEIEDLFRLIAELKASGMGIVYISHRMDEIKRISDKVTIMRDGTYVTSSNTADISIDEIIRLMVGRTIFVSKPKCPIHPSEEIVLSAHHIHVGHRVRDASFELRKGEILGFAGLVGAGRTELARAVFGADKRDSGEIYVNGKKARIRHPHDAVKYGIGYLSEDRKIYGLALGLDVENNLALAAYHGFVGKLGFIDHKKLRKSADKLVDELKIVTPSVKQLAKNLSGGNQQKIVIGKWLLTNCDILIFDEPTRGIDIGAKNEIYKMLNNLASQGKSIIMISSEMPEVLRMSHRIMVMCEGRITGELTAEEAGQEQIMQYAAMRSESAAST